jgi:uncharacterized membrane protein (DUF373 family)
MAHVASNKPLFHAGLQNIFFVLQRRFPHYFPELPVKIRQVVKTAFVAHLRNVVLFVA